jgi:hypothetical protein
LRAIRCVYADSNANLNGNSDCNSHANGHLNGISNRDSDWDRYANCHGYSDAQTNPYAAVNPDCQASPNAGTSPIEIVIGYSQFFTRGQSSRTLIFKSRQR